MVTENYCKKTLFISVLICLFVFYSGFFEIPQRNPLKTIIPQEQDLIELLPGGMFLVSNKYKYGVKDFILRR